MSIRVAVRHNTYYKFDRHVSLAPHILRLRPAPHCRNRIYSYSLKIEPEPHFINWQQDPFGNFLARLVFPEKENHLSVEVEIITDMTVINPFDFFVEEYAEHFPFEYDVQLRQELAPYLEVSHDGPLLQQWLAEVSSDSMPINDFLVSINQRLQADIAYNIRMEPGVQSCEQTLQLRRGSCRDTSWLLVQVLRHLGLAARFCSGYLVQLTPDVKPLSGPSGPSEDFTDLHAWCEVYVPGAGWVGLDPTSGLFAGEGHIPLACTPSPMSAAAISGATDECEVEFNYVNEVERIHEDPRVTKPYDSEQWQSIQALGKAVDEEFERSDVRLTMGGEPTFVSIDDMDSAQWNIAALGEDKLALAKQLLLRLRDRFAPGGVLQYGQGKWYPGEPIPRWSLGCYWRTDGKNLWSDPALLASEGESHSHTLADAERFINTLTETLRLDSGYVRTAYEDAMYYLWKEQQLPDDQDPLQADLKDDLERKRIAALLSRGLDQPTGYILPLQREEDGPWRSGVWRLRAKHIFLSPGDSPMGLRLPLDSLLTPTDEDAIKPERDPFAEREPLSTDDESQDVQANEEDAATVVRTTLCVEPRDGQLHVFLPPLEHLEHFVDLINALERSAKELKLPITIEGYQPPHDPRLQRLFITPDPGVIEVNVHPASNWQALASNTIALYEEAHQCRLGTEKFMLDGRHSGTGGGNHITLGSAKPEDSPFLRRPDLLRSLLTYWQHHPGLSYLFSGLFIGPTSQAPRVDEGRDEMLYELEIAFSQFPDGEVAEPWLVDRLLRNLLIDITGNTHRSEFCIDKLYSPGSASGRLGLLEFRGFEMPPHQHMALVQVLLLRCLVARFWNKPYKGKLVRWGTALHDRFMLPHYVWSDIKQVVEDLNEHGYAFELDWLAPFEEFRFPHYGSLTIEDISLELRWAIEPWHVLGEEVSSFGTSRYVDSSVERLQVKLNGVTSDRYVLSCNGRRVPLRPTGCQGEFVAAVRYRAWQPPSALHPRIGIHAPLVFDLIDTWNGRSVGACTYHVAHPGGRSYDNSPVNAFEAEARRVSRFWNFGHTPGKSGVSADNIGEAGDNADESAPFSAGVPPEERSDEYPHTLDLRRPLA